MGSIAGQFYRVFSSLTPAAEEIPIEAKNSAASVLRDGRPRNEYYVLRRWVSHH
jgi:hypothetical protein